MSFGGRNQGRGLNIRWLPIVIGLIVIGVTMARGCQEGPFGRKQIVALSPEQESALGAQAFREVLQTSNVLPDGSLVYAVRDIARRLVAAAGREDVLSRMKIQPQKYEWQVSVVRSDQVNAFCLPGGKIVVYTGIIPVARTEAGLATVMGHEIGHALAHHGAERMAHQQMVQIGQMAAYGSMGDMDPQQRRQLMGVIAAGSNLGILLPYSRSHETEADHIGILLMAGAGYDPRESVRFWQRMTEQAGGRGAPAEFLSTHPGHEHRVRDLEGWMDEAVALFNSSSPAPGGNKPLPRQ